jgi:hypothetical protein
MIERKKVEKIREENMALKQKLRARRLQKIDENDEMEKGVSFYSLKRSP